MDMTPKEYQAYVKRMQKKSPLGKDMALAFVIGGLICVAGQAIGDGFRAAGLNTEDAGTATSVSLVFLSALLTGLGLYHRLARFGGAGTLVPITGFANAVVSPALDFKAEGFVTGMAAKMFVIAGPVIVYGTLAFSWKSWKPFIRADSSGDPPWCRCAGCGSRSGNRWRYRWSPWRRWSGPCTRGRPQRRRGRCCGRTM